MPVDVELEVGTSGQRRDGVPTGVDFPHPPRIPQSARDEHPKGC
jgi:hypothetical protein